MRENDDLVWPHDVLTVSTGPFWVRLRPTCW